jgi:hypothetical protein
MAAAAACAGNSGAVTPARDPQIPYCDATVVPSLWVENTSAPATNRFKSEISNLRFPTLRCANTDRVNGWAQILHRMGDPANGVPPRLFIHERCARLVECLPSLQHDPNRPEDVLKVNAGEDDVGGDDAADCLRYLVATKVRGSDAEGAEGAMKWRRSGFKLWRDCVCRAGIRKMLK